MQQNRPHISSKDFFQLAKPFSVWLVKKCKTRIQDLSPPKAHKFFRKFVKRWNNNQLNPLFYRTQDLVRQYRDLLNSSFDWKIKLSPEDVENIKEISQGILALSSQFRNQEGVELTIPDNIKRDLVLQKHLQMQAKKQKEQYLKKVKDRIERKHLNQSLGPKALQPAFIKKRALNSYLNGERDSEDQLNPFEEDPDKLKKKEDKKQLDQHADRHQRIRQYEMEEKRKTELFLRSRYKE